MKNKIKILFLIDTLGGGGAERVLVNLVNHMDKTKYDVTVMSMFGGGVNSQRILPHITYIERKFPYTKGLSLIFKFLSPSLLYRVFVGCKEYDVIIAYMQGPSTKVLAGCKNDNIVKMSWLHCDNVERFVYRCWFNKNNVVKAYNKFDAVCGVSKAVISSYDKEMGINNSFVIYNTNDTDYIRKKAKSAYNMFASKCNICTAGRLATQKGYDRLINVAKRLWDEGYRFDISILGDGPKKEELIKQITALNAEEYIHLLGFCDNPYAIMSKSDLFVSSSRWEGLSTVVTEAIILGLPVVATDVSGTKEVLGDNNEYGIVTTNDEEGIYQGLKQIIGNQELLAHYRERAKERSVKFEPESTVSQVENLIESLIKK